MRERPRKVKVRKAALRRAGRTYQELATRAGVTYSMAWKWMNGDRESRPCEEAFHALLAGAPKDRPLSPAAILNKAETLLLSTEKKLAAAGRG